MVGSRIERFEDLLAWQRARELTREMYRVTASGPLAKDFDLRRQIRRAAISTMANIAEGFERNRATEFHQFLSMAKGSCAELRSHLYVAFDAKHIEDKTFTNLLGQAESLGRILGALRAAVEKQRPHKRVLSEKVLSAEERA